MKKILCLMMMCLLCSVSKVHAYLIDGSISDWGVDLSLPGSDVKKFLDNNLPTDPDIDVVTEDNADRYSSSTIVGPGSSTRNTYDAEAMYFDNDDTYAYLAIVSGLERSEWVYPAGDIFIATTADPFSNKKYEYAINVFTGDVYLVGTTATAVQNVAFIQHSEANPWRLTRTTNTGTISSANTWIGKLNSDEFVYGSLYNTHTVIEARIPLAWINADDDVWMHWTMKCGNDYLNLHGTVTTTPEPATVMLLGSGLLGLAGLRRRKSKV